MIVSLFSSHQVGAKYFDDCMHYVGLYQDKILWPVLVTTMSLPPKIRMDAENVMVAALWLGSCKPPMDILLRSTLSIIEDLTKGIEFTTPQGRI